MGRGFFLSRERPRSLFFLLSLPLPLPLPLSLSLSLSPSPSPSLPDDNDDNTSSGLQARQGLAPHPLRRRQPRSVALPLPHRLAPPLWPGARVCRRSSGDPGRASGISEVPRGVRCVDSDVESDVREQDLGSDRLRHRARGQQVRGSRVRIR